MGARKSSLSFGGELGRTRFASAREHRSVRSRGLAAEVARAARHRALDALLHRLRTTAAKAVLRLFSQGRAERMGSRATRASQRSARRSVRGALRRRVADRAHAVDAFLFL